VSDCCYLYDTRHVGLPFFSFFTCTEPTLEPTPEEVGYDDEDLAAYAEAYDDDWDEYADAVLDLTDADLARLAQDESNAMRASTPGMDMS
jgi:hypothetical protein